jgi:DNA-directed RNA polymerase subunit RPC12/RpoP
MHKYIEIEFKFINMLYKCDRCEKEFEKKYNYTAHMKRKFPCKALIKENEIIEKTNNVNINNYICDTCNKGFTYTYLLERHKNRKYPCKKKEEIIMKYCTYCGECMEEKNLKKCKKIKEKPKEKDNKKDTNNKTECKYCNNIVIKAKINRHYRICDKIPKNKQKYYIEKYKNHGRHKNKK